MNGKISAVDLFCGAGGLTYGLELAGISVRCGIDIDPECQYPYTKNNRSDFLLKSVCDIHVEDIKKYYQRKYSLLAGCAPCQTFSKYNPKAKTSDKRWHLLFHFGQLIKDLLPDFVTMENVPPLVSQTVFTQFLDILEEKNYYVWYRIVNCSEYGLPQHRCRLVVLASRFGNISLLSPDDFQAPKKTVRDVIGHLPPIEAGEKNQLDVLHTSPSLTPINLERIQHSKPGGTWREWPSHLHLKCHTKASGTTYPSVYGRMEWDSLAPTLTTQFYGYGNGRFGHPEQNRAISLREGAILQGFPEDYEFVPPEKPVITKNIGRMIGNAVPVVLGKVIGKSILEHCKGISK